MSSGLSQALLSRVFPGVVDAPRTTTGVREWVDAGIYALDNGSTSADFSLVGIDKQSFIPYLAHDFWRFALASAETCFGGAPEFVGKRALAWPLIRRYYGSYFSAHAIMRALGRGVLRLESEQATRLTELARVYCTSAVRIDSGSYEIRIANSSSNPGSLKINFLKLQSSRGGNHEQFWMNFNSFLSLLATEVANAGDINASATASEIEDLRSILTSMGRTGGTWLSFVRNKVNYQQGYGVWFPYAGSNSKDHPSSDRRFALNKAIRLDFDSRKNPLLAYDAATTFISLTGINLATSLANRAPKGEGKYPQIWHSLNKALKS